MNLHSNNHSPVTLVLVDNEAAMRGALGAYLGLHKAVRVLAHCGERDAISTVQDLKPDLVVLTSDRLGLIREVARAAPAAKILGRLAAVAPTTRSRFLEAGGWEVVDRLTPAEDVLERVLSARALA